MGWKVISEITEVEVDINPDLYVKRAEDALIRHCIQDAITEIDTAIEYARKDMKSHYQFEKVKILYGAKMNSVCYSFIASYIKTFFAELSMDKFMQLLNMLSVVANLTNKNASTLLTAHGIHAILLNELHADKIDDIYILGRARECLIKRKYNEASQYCDLGIYLNSACSEMYEIKGRCYHAEKNYDVALEYYNKSILLDKSNVPALLSRSQVYSTLGKLDETIKSIDMILAIMPNNLDYLHLKAKEYLKANDYQSALTHLQGMKHSSNVDARTFNLMGQAHDGLGNFWRALFYYKISYHKDKSYPIPNEHLRQPRIQSVKRRIALMSLIVTVLMITQFLLFKSGVLPAIVFETQIVKTSDVVAVGGTLQLSERHRWFPYYAVDPKLTFKVRDESLVKIDSDGRLSGLKGGNAEVLLMQGRKIIDKFTITSIVPRVTKITLGTTKNSLKFGDTLYLKPEVTMNHDEFPKEEIQFSSSDPTIISVSNIGIVRAVGVGTAEILVRAGGVEEKVMISSEPIVKIQTEKRHYEAYYGDRLKISPMVVMSPKEARAPELEYESLNPDIANIDSGGKIDVVGIGIALIELRAGEATTQIAITSSPRTEEILFEEKVYEIKYRETFKLPQPRITISPVNASVPQIEYTSTDERVIQVDKDGNVTAIGVGEANVVVTVGNKSEKLHFSSNAIVKSLQLNNDYLKMNIGEVKYTKLTVVLEPAGAPVPEITYGVTDTEMIKVSESGEIQAIRNGYTVINIACGDISVPLYIEVLNGVKEGYGTYFGYKGSDSYRYDGEFSNYKFHGDGKMIFESGAMYQGSWTNGNKDGYGTMIYDNGDKYTGEWKNDKRHGFGSYTWINGDEYVGQWSGGEEHGKGTLTLANGTIYSGTWNYGYYRGR